MQQGDLVLGRHIGLEQAARRPVPSCAIAAPAGGGVRVRQPNADAGRQAGNAPQFVERAVGDLDAAIDDDDAIGAVLEFGQGMR